MQEANIHTDLDILIRARYPIIFVESFEENRVIKIVESIIGTDQQDENGKTIYLWSGTTGLTDTHGNPVKEGTEDPLIAMETIDETDRPMIIIFKDLHRYIEDIMVYRKLRDLHQNLKTTHKTIIIISPVLTIPIELQKVITVVSLPLPNTNELNTVMESVISAAEDNAQANHLTDQIEIFKMIWDELENTRENILNAGLGLTLDEFENVIAKSIVQHRQVRLETIIAEKEQIIKKSGILEFFTSQEDMGEVGGLEVLKEWIQKRKLAFSKEAVEFGLKIPKGVFLCGPPGTGKSLTSKVISKYMAMPLLKLDVSKIYGSLVGQSEQNIALALKTAEAVAPCVTGDTKIVCGDGTVTTAESLYNKAQLNQRVVAMDLENQLWTVPLIGVIKKKAIDGLYKITTTASTIQVTGNHKLMTEHGWAEAKTLNKNDWLFMPHLKPPLIKPIDVCELMPKDAKKLNDNTWRRGRGGWTDSKLSINCKIVTEEFTELLGYIDSDGYMNDYGRIAFYNSNIKLLDRFDELIENIFNLQPNRILNSHRPGDIAIKNDGETINTRKLQYVSYVNSTLLVKVLTNLRNNLLDFNYTELIPAYIRAFVNGDGYIDNKQGRIIISQKSKKNQELITELLRRMGIFSRFRRNNKPYHNPKPTQNLSLSGEMGRRLLKQLSNASGPTNDKISRAEFIKTQFTHINGRAIKIQESGVYSRIEFIESIPDEDVFDLSCLKIHNYISNGFVSHNCVLWLDEIEKALAGSQSSGTTDSGVSARVLGSFLQWLQDHESPVFVIATSNNPSAIPPEFIRAGRFDQVFMVDLPQHSEREDIFRIHINKTGRDADLYPLDEFAGITDGFSGAEIEQVIHDAMYEAFFEKHNLDDTSIKNAIKTTIPLSKKRKEDINALRKWGASNAISASKHDDVESTHVSERRIEL